MIQIKWWFRSSSDDPDWVMIQIQQWWSRSSDDPDRVMIQIQWWYLVMMIKIQKWRWHEDKDDLEMQMTRRSTEQDQWWKLFRENTFPVKKECWCNCNFRMYSLVFIIYCNPIFIPGCYYVMSCPDVPIGKIYNVNKSCQFIMGNPPIV